MYDVILLGMSVKTTSLLPHPVQHTPEERKVEQHDHWQRVGSSEWRWASGGAGHIGLLQRLLRLLLHITGLA